MTGNDKDITCLSQTLACYFSGGVQFRLAKTTLNHPSTDHKINYVVRSSLSTGHVQFIIDRTRD